VIFLANAEGIVLKPGDKMRVPDIPGQTEEARAAGVKPPVVVSSAAAEAANKASAEHAEMFKEADDALKAGKFDEAVTKLNALNERIQKCAPCHVKLGEAYLGKKDEAAAEKAFLQAIELDETLPAPYTQLAVIYNGQRKFDEASAMSTKANELIGAGGGGGDSASIFNQGVIFWNSGKTAEAKAEFAKAVKLDPRNAEAQYWLGMSTYSLAMSGTGSAIDAKAPFEEYLKLAPTGEFADVAKAMLAIIK
jgi:tetratricopeptide (TPR) repeat protein